MIERLLLHFVFAFVATICFAILLNVPRRAYLAGGVIGGATWVIYVVMYFHLHVGLAPSNLSAAILIGILAMMAAKVQHQPMPAFPYTADYFSGLTATTAALAAPLTLPICGRLSLPLCVIEK